MSRCKTAFSILTLGTFPALWEICLDPCMYRQSKCSQNKGTFRSLAGSGNSSHGALGCSPHSSIMPALAHVAEHGFKKSV